MAERVGACQNIGQFLGRVHWCGRAQFVKLDAGGRARDTCPARILPETGLFYCLIMPEIAIIGKDVIAKHSHLRETWVWQFSVVKGGPAQQRAACGRQATQHEEHDERDARNP